MEQNRVEKDSKKKKERGGKNGKVHSCRAGDTCPVCYKSHAIVSRGKIRTALGDGMAGMEGINLKTLLFPLECKYCYERFKKKHAATLLLRPFSVVARLLFGPR